MSGVLIIGAGGVGRVVAHKCVLNVDVFEKVTLASKTLAKCEEIKSEIKNRWGKDIEIDRVDADNTNSVQEIVDALGALNLAMETRLLSLPLHSLKL